MAVIIPKPYKDAVAAMAGMDGPERHALLEALDSAPTPSSIQRLEAHLAGETSIARAKIRATIGAASSLLVTAEGSDAAFRTELANGVSEAAARERLGGLAPNDVDAISAFGEFLLALIERESVLGIVAKVANLLYDHGTVYLESRILTDFRPLFDDGEKPTTLRAGMIIHTLRLNLMSSDGQDSPLYVALDQADLISLRTTIDRAMAKEKLLRERLKPLDLPLVSPEE